MQRTINAPDSSIGYDRGHVVEVARRAAVLVVVVTPFIATAVAIVQLWQWAVTWSDLALLIVMYLPISLGVTAGFHRMLTHRSFRAHPVVRGVILILGSMAVEGTAITWAANHLKHHALADKEGDPHSPVDGIFHAHLGWLFTTDDADPKVYCRHLLKDPVVVFVDRTFLVWVALSLLIPFAIGGWTGLLWGGLVRMFYVHHITWSVNSVCHTFGKRTFETTDRSRNQWTIGLLALGEGWHNNHHAVSALGDPRPGSLAVRCLGMAYRRPGALGPRTRCTAHRARHDRSQAAQLMSGSHGNATGRGELFQLSWPAIDPQPGTGKR